MMFEDDLRQLLNKHSVENESDTPDFILAEYLNSCLDILARAVQNREKWYGREKRVVPTLECPLVTPPPAGGEE